MASIDFTITGGVTDNSAIVSSKLNYTLPTAESELKILRVDYTGSTYSSYINGSFVTSSSATGNWAFIYNMMMGSDSDSSDYFYGYIPELLIYKNPLAATSSVAIERWMADKWLTTGTNINGYTASSINGGFPGASNTKYLHFDETGLTYSGGKVTSWTDKATFAGVNKVGIPLGTASRPDIDLAKFKGKNVAKFSGAQNLKVTGLSASADPDFFTLFLVYKFDNFDASTSQTVLGTIDASGTTFNNAIRFKKYNTDAFWSLRINTGSFRTLTVDRSIAYSTNTPTELYLGYQSLLYSTSPTFSSYTTTATYSSYFSTNGVIKYNLSGLTGSKDYYYKVSVNGVTESNTRHFKTFEIEKPLSFKFIAGSCNRSGSTSSVWTEMKNENPLFWAHMGDWHYQDISANDKQLFRDAFNMTATQSNINGLMANVPLTYMFDDHDFGANNSDMTSASRPAVISFYQETIPSYPLHSPDTNGVYHSFTVGRVRFIHTDMRSNRTPFLALDISDPAKSIMGATQKAWLKQELIDAKNNPNIALTCWLNPTPWTGDSTNPYSWDYGSPGEHYTAYLVERADVYQYIYDNDIQNLFIINGDTHQQAIDDGRNSVYATGGTGSVIDWRTLPSGLLTPVIEASPFDKDVDNGSGQFQINDFGDSGKVSVKSEQSYTTFDVTDLGYNWIRVDVKQYALPDGLTYYSEKTLVNSFSFTRDCNGTTYPKPILNNVLSKTVTGHLHIGGTESISTKNIQWINPTSFADNYKAPITGQVINHTLDNLSVSVYRRADMDYLVGTCSVSNSTGQFTFAGSFGVSQLVFKVYNKFGTKIDEVVNDGIASQYYTDLELQLFYTTDIDYYQKSFDVAVGSTYSVTYASQGQKVKIKLVRKSTGATLSSTRLFGNLPRSYKIDADDPALHTPFANKSYLYDAALALITSFEFKTEDIGMAFYQSVGILNSQFPDGSFPFSTNHIFQAGADKYVRNGATAWVAYALGYYLEHYPDAPNRADVETGLRKVCDYLDSYRAVNGLVKGGSGLYTGLSFSATYSIPWTSTEHNIDSYFAFKQAGYVLSSATYSNIANEISTSIQSYLYDSVNHRMYQGIDGSGSSDTADALDINSWGACFWIAIGRNDVATLLLNRCDTYYYCTDVTTGVNGYKPYNATLGYPGAVDTVWFEGSFGVALAHKKLGNIDKYNQIITELYRLMETDGSFRYSTLRDAIYEISNSKSIASTCWSVICGLDSKVWI